MGCAVATCKGSRPVIHCSTAEMDNGVDAGLAGSRTSDCDCGNADAVVHVEDQEPRDENGLEEAAASEIEISTSKTALMASESRHSFNCE